jgi:very-short-patch-repair endonuclease
MTPAEEHLWQRIRRKNLHNYKFRRQHPIDRFIVDFYCAEAFLVIEVDGDIHEYTQEQDALRQAFLESLGLRVLRFSNGDIMKHTDAVVERIGEVLQEWEDQPHPQPLPKHGEGSPEISKWDIFYYVYALLHHPGYRERYADNLKRELPRIPFAPDFWSFAVAGRRLAELHLNYETVEPYPLEYQWKPGKPVNWRVEKKMVLGPSDTHVPFGEKDGKPIYTPLGDVRVNDSLRLHGIPPEVQQYRLGNRSALEWVIDQYQVKTDARSGITSDPNGYSEDEQYIVRLVGQVVAVSLETVEIVNSLAALPFREEGV